jgi:hypothetical protein
MKKQDKLPTAKIGRPRSSFPVIEGLSAAAAVLGCPVSIVKAVKREGSQAFLAGGRVDTGILVPEVIRKLQESSGGGLDLQQELAIKAREDSRAKKRENDLAEGLIHTREDMEELFWENGLKPLRDVWLAFGRKYAQLARQGGSVDHDELARDLDVLRARLRNATPARYREPEGA